jgi:hypothetical protein
MSLVRGRLPLPLFPDLSEGEGEKGKTTRTDS